MTGLHRNALHAAKAQPFTVVWLSFVVIVVAAGLVAWFWVSGSDSDDETSPTPSPTATSPSPSPEASPTPSPTLEVEEGPDRSLDVIIYNNSRIEGIAGRTATVAREAGWTVVDETNWTGSNLPRTTVFYPEGAEEAAQLLADDLGINHIEVNPDSLDDDRLTVVMTAVNE